LQVLGRKQVRWLDGVAGYWWAAVPDEHWPEDQNSRDAIEKIGMI
jgi:hypothetical protein